jgi:lipoprotein NlpI
VARGIAYDNLGRRDEARKDFEAALALDAESSAALNAAAVNAQSRGRPDEAVDYASRVLRQQPRDAEALHVRALAHYFAGRLPEARADWDTALGDSAAVRRGYPLLWQALATRRAGEDLAPLLQKYPREQWPTDWPRPVLDAVFGPLTIEAALQAARGTKTPLEAQSEALFYLGEKLAIEGDVSKARDQWRKVIDLGVVEFVENSAARLRLADTR